ncbi:MAG TPA: DUF4296 domain-containing protein [Ignavibacteriaceae bacterium]|nr:DUF4296 domain-containing protein [Ignavibacteriaceae bacterium]
MKRLFKFFYLIFSTLLFSILINNCSDNKIIEQDKFVLIYSDMLIAQDTVSIDEKGADSLKLSIFKKHNVTKNDYEKTIEYYNEDLERWEEFFDKVTAHISELKTKN